MNWEMIEHVCISIAVVGAALTYIYKGMKFAKKPAEDVNAKLERDFKRINELEERQDYNCKSIKLLMRSEMAILKHLQSGNSTGEMSKVEKDIKEFLLNH